MLRGDGHSDGFFVDVQTDIDASFHGCLVPFIDDESGALRASLIADRSPLGDNPRYYIGIKYPLNFFVKPYGLGHFERMDFVQIIIAIPWFGGGLLLWPVFLIFRGRSDARSRPLRKIFFLTLAAVGGLAAFLGVVAFLGRFDHNWLPLTLLIPVINFTSIVVSIMIWCIRDHVA
jgi:hypothetical protein